MTPGHAGPGAPSVDAQLASWLALQKLVLFFQENICRDAVDRRQIPAPVGRWFVPVELLFVDGG